MRCASSNGESRDEFTKGAANTSSGGPAISPDDRMAPRESTSGGPTSVAVKGIPTRCSCVQDAFHGGSWVASEDGSSPLEFVR